MNRVGGQKLIFPGLAGFYASWREIAYALVRIVIGYILLMHGWAKVNGGFTGVAASMAQNGLVPSEFFAGAAMFLETVGAICIIVGLFTRFFAAALAIELGIAFLVVHMSKGFAAAHFSCSLSQYAAAVPIRLTAQSARNFRPPKHSVSPSRSRF